MTERTIARPGDDVPPERYGHKSAWLSWLHHHGYRIPETVFVRAMVPETVEERLADEQTRQAIQQAIAPLRTDDGTYDVAIRSSATNEDTAGASRAGHFETYMGEFDKEEIFEKIARVVRSLDTAPTEAPGEMGVIIQSRVEAAHSGVAFSSDPVGHARAESIASVVDGAGESLVSGLEAGTEIRAEVDDSGVEISTSEASVSEETLKSLFAAVNDIEEEVGWPMDVEWCVEAETGILWFLQCRPDASIETETSSVVRIDDGVDGQLPTEVLRNPQFQKRVRAADAGIQMPEMFVVPISCIGGETTIPDLGAIQPTTDRAVYTVVLLHPSRLDESTKANALPERMTFDEFINQCQRYCVRSYPRYESLSDDIKDIADVCCQSHWSAAVLVQEIDDPAFTGIVKQVDDEYVVEIGRGHLVAKGLVAVSRYVLDDRGVPTQRHEVTQDRQFSIVDGYVLEEEFKSDTDPVSIPKSVLATLVKEFDPVLERGGMAVEFGLVETNDDYQPYLIDFVVQNGSDRIESTMMDDRVLSPGSGLGTLVSVDRDAMAEDASAEITQLSESVGDGSAVFYCDRPDISLLELVDQFDERIAGFVFEKGSMLSHFPVVLRERGIPAVLASDEDVQFGKRVRIDARPERSGSVDRLTYRD